MRLCDVMWLREGPEVELKVANSNYFTITQQVGRRPRADRTWVDVYHPQILGSARYTLADTYNTQTPVLLALCGTHTQSPFFDPLNFTRTCLVYYSHQRATHSFSRTS